jgi:hypothetical protein
MLPFDEDGSFDKQRMSNILIEGLRCFFDVPMADRAAHPARESQIVDCLYQDLFRDPIGMVKTIYTKFGLEYTQVFEDRMQVYLANNKQGKYGRHKYDNAEYGIDPEQLKASLRDYYVKYGYGVNPEKHD